MAAAALLVACIHIAGNGHYAYTNSELAALVWDGSTHTEHLIRMAEFQSDAEDIGFMVPTPTEPTLHEADPKLFLTLAMIERQHRPELQGVKSSPASVAIVRRVQVGGYDATVLKADTAGAAEDWLRKNQYPVSGTAKEWLEPYVRQGWYITAFKLSDPDIDLLKLKPVRLTFRCDKPFYPYREPKQKNPKSRMFQLFVVGDHGYEGRLGESPWMRPTFSGTMSAEEQESVKKLLPDLGFAPTHLTAYTDTSNPRDGHADLTFEEVSDGRLAFGYLARTPSMWVPTLIVFCALALSVGRTLLRRPRRGRAISAPGV